MIIPNYTGDCLNFGLAIETAIEDGILVDSVIVNDDCALIQQTKGTDGPSKVGARGLGAMVIVQKVCDTRYYQLKYRKNHRNINLHSFSDVRVFFPNFKNLHVCPT